MSRFSLFVAVMLTCFSAQPAQAQYEKLQELLRRSWQKVAPLKGSVVPIEYAVANGMYAREGQAMSGKGMLLPARRSALLFREGAKKYEFYEKGAALAFRVGKADFERAAPKHRAQHTALLSYISPGELVTLLLHNVERIRRAGTDRVKGVTCLVYRVTYSVHNIGALLKRVGMTAELAQSPRKRRGELSSTFIIERKTGRLRQLHVNLKLQVKREEDKKKKKKSDWSWEGATGGMGVIVEKDGKVLSGPKKTPTEFRTYGMKATFLSPQPAQAKSKAKTEKSEIPERVKKLLNW